MNAVRMASELTLYTIVIMAVVQDLQSMKISNRLILAGLVLSLVFGIILGRAPQILYILGNIFFPVIVLYLLYLLGVLGAGDIKLFSVIGGFTNLNTLINCILAAFGVGAVFSLIKLLYQRSLGTNLRRAGLYIQELLQGNIHAYPREGENKNVMHFSVAILVGLVIAKSVC